MGVDGQGGGNNDMGGGNNGQSGRHGAAVMTTLPRALNYGGEPVCGGGDW